MLLRTKISLFAALLSGILILAACNQATPAQPVATTSAPADEAAPVPPPTDELVMLRANSWQWVSFADPAESFEVQVPANYRATFNNDATVIIKADCYNATGSYQGEGGDLAIEVGPLNQTSCAAGSRSLQFITLLGGAANYFFEGKNLRIDLKDDNGTMVFAPVGVTTGTGDNASKAISSSALVDILSNLSYNGIFPDQPITLTNGYAYYDDGSYEKPFVRLIDHLIAKGDLNQDGAEDVVILLEHKTSGTGRFIYAVPVLDVWGNPTPTEALMIGDRIQVKSLAIYGTQVVADLVAHGPDDAACCASWNVRKLFSLENDRLTERSSEELSRISLGDLNGTQWRLVDINMNQELILPDTEITMQLANGQISGFTGCNNYNTTISSQENSPQSLIVGLIATTKKLCPERVMNQEQTYLTRLGKVVAWWSDAGRLVFTYELGEAGFGNLVFESTAATATQAPNAFSRIKAVPFDLGETVLARPCASTCIKSLDE